MASLTLKNIPADLHRKLRARAAEHGRSLNSEAIAALREATARPHIDPRSFLTRVRRLRKGLRVWADDETIHRFRSKGRM